MLRRQSWCCYDGMNISNLEKSTELPVFHTLGELIVVFLLFFFLFLLYDDDEPGAVRTCVRRTLAPAEESFSFNVGTGARVAATEDCALDNF